MGCIHTTQVQVVGGVRDSHSQVFRLPQGVTYEQGALIEPLSVALQAVLDNGPLEGERVLVYGLSLTYGF